ncbi:CRE-SNT-7 protein [Caenorhabditis remanei]|uniref:CRE-SNT-7 protein n=2 Tax=Caenorhabditis remanei TaxID=31234 RepID=E3MCC1_CAERE|nr:CRE-SNT-7 protein [Caenorhabditis remanei]
MKIPDVLENLEITEQNFLIVLCATVVIVVLFVSFLLVKSKNKLNWYDQNVLDMGENPTHRRCTTIYRTNTDEATVNEIKIGECFPAATNIPKGDLSNLFMIPKAKKGARSMFSNLHQNQFDRGLYQFPTGDESACSSVTMAAVGSIQLSVSHDVNLNLLTVTIIKAVDLPTKREDDLPNPFMKVSLEIPDSKKPEDHQTKVYNGTASPLINEDFYFSVTAQQVSTCRLEVMVYDYDQFSVDECVGYCWLTLGRINEHFEHDCPTLFWAEVLPYEDGDNKGYGQVLFALSYLSHAQRLTMNIFKVRNVRFRNGGNVALRVTLLDGEEKPLKKKKTSQKKAARSVQFNECLTFSIPKHTLCEVFLTVELITETGTFGIASRTLSRMQLPLHKCKDLWRAIIREEKSQARWYPFEQP